MYYSDVVDGTKTFELRYNDWDCVVGHKILLQEVDDITYEYTGKMCLVEVTYILPQYMDILRKDWIIFSFKMVCVFDQP